jgi:hypothetical protein
MEAHQYSLSYSNKHTAQSFSKYLSMELNPEYYYSRYSRIKDSCNYEQTQGSTGYCPQDSKELDSSFGVYLQFMM